MHISLEVDLFWWGRKMNEIDRRKGVRNMNVQAGFVFVVGEPDDHDVKIAALSYTSLKGKCLTGSCMAVDAGSVLRMHVCQLPPHITPQGAIWVVVQTREELEAFVVDFEKTFRVGVGKARKAAKPFRMSSGVKNLKTGLCRSKGKRT